MKAHWERESQNWLQWARTPGHDSYWLYRESFFQILPTAGRLTLDLGCGEGRVSRDLAVLGHEVVGVDASPTLIRHAQESSTGERYLMADAASLPFEAGSFDLVIAYNSLMDMDEMSSVVLEAARVLSNRGRFALCITHPVAEAGKFASKDPDARFVIEGDYFGPRLRTEETFERDGLEMTFRGWAHSIEEYSRALEEVGLLIELIREPQPSARGLERQVAIARWMRLPLFLQMRALKVS